MRLISQTRKVDIPYEQTILTACSDGNICATVFEDGQDFAIAEYETEEKALKVMEMVRDAYIGSSLTVFKDYSFDNAKEFMELMKKSNAVILESGDRQPEFHHFEGNEVFIFPADEDVTI